jgi:hypothetical protein
MEMVNIFTRHSQTLKYRMIIYMISSFKTYNLLSFNHATDGNHLVNPDNKYVYPSSLIARASCFVILGRGIISYGHKNICGILVLITYGIFW